MWQETNKGLYKKFDFPNFAEAFAFMQLLTTSIPDIASHLRWENKGNEVDIWLTSYIENGEEVITEIDQNLAKEINNIFDTHQSSHRPHCYNEDFDEIKIFADGGSRGNPGPSASGYALFNMHDKTLRQEGVYIGVTTNNQAEYTCPKACT